MTSRWRVRVLVGELSRTGVPVALVRMLRWARDNRAVDVDVVAIHGGPVRWDLAEVTNSVTVLEPTGHRSSADAVAVALAVGHHPDAGQGLRNAAWRWRTRHLATPDVVLLQGASAHPLVATVDRDLPLVVHLHELAVGMQRSMSVPTRARLYQRARWVLAVSEPVAELAIRDGADPARLRIVPGVVEPSSDVMSERRGGKQLVSDEHPIVAAGGTPGWRKGTDRFIGLAHALARSHPSAKCLWVGGRPLGTEVAAKASLDPVRWIDNIAEPWDELGRAAVLVIPSREDALPLVALEAGQHGVPVVAGRTGGLRDLLADGRGVLVDVHDVRRLHAAVVALLADPVRATSLAAALRGHVAEHHTVDQVGPLWWSSLVDAEARR